MADSTIPPADSPGEPLLTVGGITAAATALLGILITAGLPISTSLRAWILSVVAVAAPAIVALIGRGRVYSPATVRHLLTSQGGAK